MAEKKVIELEIKSNLNVAEKQLKDLGNAIKIVDKEATNLDATFEEIYGDIKPLTAQMGELEDRLYELAKAGKQNTKEYQDLLREVGKYKRIQQETDKVVDAAAQTMSSKLSGSLNAAAGGFSLVQGSMALFGAESTQVEEAILKVQAAMAISQGVQTIQEGAKSVTALGNSVKSYAIVQRAITAGQWLWNAAMTANPIGLLIAGIAALIAGGIALTNYFKSNAIAAEKNAASIKANKTALENQSKAADKAGKSLQTNNDYQLEMAKATGASTAAIRKLELKLIDEKIAFADSSREIAKNTYHKNLNALASLKAADADEEQIKLQEEITQKSLEEFGKQTKNLNDANVEKGNIIRKQNVEIRQEQTNHNKEIRDKNNADADKDKADALAKAKEKADALKTFNDDVLKNQQQMNVDKVNKDIQDKLDEKTSQEERLQGISDQVDAIDALNQKEVDDAKIKKDKLAQDEIDAQKRKYEALSLITQGGMNLLAALQDAGIAKSKAGQMAMKALTLVQIGIDTASAFSNAVPMAIKAGAEAAKLAGPGAPIAGPLATAASYLSSATMIASNIAKAKKLLSSGGSATPASGGGGGGSASTPAAPAFNVVGASPTNQLAQTIGNQQQQPIKAYVVSNDVTTAQSLDRNIISSASIG